jgi:hypothetical protein
MNPDTELEQWRGAWQSETAVPADLRRRVARQSRFMRIMLAGDILVTVVIGGGATLLAARSPRLDMLLLAGATWLFIAIAWVFRLVVSRGLWSPPAMDTGAFVELLIRGCRAKLAATWFGGGLFICEIAFCFTWIHGHSWQGPGLSTWLIVVAISIAFFAFLAWYRRRKRAELAWLLGLRTAGGPE